MLQDQSLLIYFFSGLVFFILGLLALLERKRNSQLEFLRFLPYLGVFAVFQGLSYWISFFNNIPSEILGVNHTSLIILKPICSVIAFVTIFFFGLNLSKQSFSLSRIRPILILHFSLFLIAFVIAYTFEINTINNLIVDLSRYIFALPGGILAALGAWKKAENIEATHLERVAKSLRLMSLGFALYSLLFVFHSSIEILQQYLLIVLLLKTITITTIVVCSYNIITTSERQYQQTLQAKVNSLEILSHVDEVSGLHNHRYFQDCLKQLVNKGSRENQDLSFSLLLIDIDYFKEFNDTYGHPEGDKLLNEIGRLIKNLIRNTDVVARYGGDELAVILQHTLLSEAYEVAEKIRRDIASHCFLNSPSKKVTLSIGVANLPHCAQTKEELIQVADTALYRAKVSRNKTECYSLF